MIEELILRYRERLKNIYKTPNPYYQHPAWEKSEIETKIKQLEKILNKSYF